MLTNYYQNESYVSNSMLTKRDKQLRGVDESAYNDSYRLGTLFDALETEPDSLNLITRRIGEYSYTLDEVNESKKMLEQLRNDPLYMRLSLGAKKQFEHYDEATPFEFDGWKWKMKTRRKFDLFHPTIGVDLKTTAATTQKGFEAAAKHFDYDRQAHFYMLPFAQMKTFYIIGVSKKYPYNVFKIKLEKNMTEGEYKTNKLAYNFIDTHGTDIIFE